MGDKQSLMGYSKPHGPDPLDAHYRNTIYKLEENVKDLRAENESLKAEINGATRPDGIKTQGLKAFAAALKERCGQFKDERDKYKAALKEVCQTLGPDTECSENMCEGCKAEMGMAYAAALKALDKPHGWPYENLNTESTENK